ncbi:hypothetical protein [Legionella quateirensis]|nr:hypothetical protein [Legionella quateirensis]
MTQNMKNPLFFGGYKGYQQLVIQVGGTPAALHNACIVQFK